MRYRCSVADGFNPTIMRRTLSASKKIPGDLMNNPVIRRYEEKDWPAIWPFFRDIAAAQETYTYPVDVSEDLARTLWLAPPPAQTVVAVDENGTVLGTAK